MKSGNILLIGFMGVGKGRLARELAERTGYFAVDTDDLIESFANRKIRKIFAQDGEPYFRSLENKVGIWLENNVKDTIISTGGGFFAVENINSIGTVIFLNSGFDAILADMMNHPKAEKKVKKRPLFRDPVQARRLFETRQPLYAAKADITIDVEGKSAPEIADTLLHRFEGLLENRLDNDTSGSGPGCASGFCD